MTETALHVHARGVDKILALRSYLEIPLTHVLGEVADPARDYSPGVYRALPGYSPRTGIIVR